MSDVVLCYDLMICVTIRVIDTYLRYFRIQKRNDRSLQRMKMKRRTQGRNRDVGACVTMMRSRIRMTAISVMRM